MFDDVPDPITEYSNIDFAVSLTFGMLKPFRDIPAY